MKIEIIIAISALVISVAGWIVAHFLTIKARKKSFLNEVTDNARLEITKAIRDYQNWLNKISTEISGLRFRITEEEDNRPVDWTSVSSEFGQLLYEGNHSLRWIFCLEEYEVLFPKTAGLRRELVGKDRKIGEDLSSLSAELIHISLLSTPLEKRKEVVKKAQKESTAICDQVTLMEDFLIYLQNFCLSSITGNKIPEREPKDPSVPRIVQDENGNLRIVPGETSTGKK
ncbi:MAG: hypothetical protein NOU37_08980 [Candidatus Brocadiales bacterium]|nr:hypothetical protein [Candidatus Bathyanammoxibius amoris]